ncbi:flagellin [Pelomonas sp. SE-A7]|uniref:flagellin n=1 Tax=Pelomonas sp. SE-A7 TaxID=3054953 RepID=UPI00259CF211|nr:flagellin [Pelomonas sp. SE-A7]MDM4768130.1 flagellin [Pelomonas sp. SE-A7]
MLCFANHHPLTSSLVARVKPMANAIDTTARILTQTQASRERSLQRLGSGKSINTASDDAAVAAIAVRLSAQLNASSQLRRNVGDALSLADTAGGALGQVSAALVRMRDLAIQAANGSYTSSDRVAIETEYAKLSETLDKQAGGVQFNGRPILDGSLQLNVQTDEQGGEQQLNLADVSTQGLRLAGQSLATADQARQAVDALDQAIEQVGAQQAGIGAAQAGFQSVIANLEGSYESLASARSRRVDTDYAAESANSSQATVRQQAALKAVALYKRNQVLQTDLLPAPIKD